MRIDVSYPAVDPRRVSDLRKVLLRDIAAMAPDWRGASEEDGADRAIVEVAARLSEEATKRLDRTPERDALAFFDMLDIAPPSPVAAEGFAVFALKEDQIRPVQAPAQTGVDIGTVDGGTAPFETVTDLQIQPARIDHLVTLDPRSDKIEIALGDVTSLEPDTTPRPEFKLLTAVNLGDRTLMIDPPVGIEEGNLLRIGAAENAAPLYARVKSFRDDGLTELIDGIEADLPAGTRVERMTRLDAFVMPNAQEHALYIGDANVLNVKERAEVTLRLNPEKVAALLLSQGAVFEIWGINEDLDEEEANWHRLVHLASSGEDLVLYKPWTGPVEERELGEKNSRWLRIRPSQDITPNEDENHPLTDPNAALKQITLGLETQTPNGDSPDETISQVAHNGLPLSRASAFLPFGPEPQRFDAFSLAAPEAFTKPGARVWLDFTLLDATLMSLSAANRFDDESHLYGVGRNGRLQVVDKGRADLLWREFTGPPVDDNPEAFQPLDPAFGVHAFGVTPNAGTTANDRLVVRTVAGGFHTVVVEHSPNKAAGDPEVMNIGTWQSLPELPDGALGEGDLPSLAIQPRKGTDTTVDGYLLMATSQDFYFLWLGSDGTHVDVWQTRPAIANHPINPKITAVFDPSQKDKNNVNADPFPKYLVADASGGVWMLNTGSNTGDWTQLEFGPFGPLKVDVGSHPTGRIYLYDNSELRMAVAGISGGKFWICEYTIPNTGPVFQRRVVDGGSGVPSDARLNIVEGLGPLPTSLPHVIAFSRDPDGGVLTEWAPDGAESSGAPLDMQSGLVHQTTISGSDLPEDEAAHPALAVFGPDTGAGNGQALALVAGSSQSVLSVPIDPSVRADLSEWVLAPDTPDDPAEFTDIAVLYVLEQIGGPNIEIPRFTVVPESDIVGVHPVSGTQLAAINLTDASFNHPASVFRLGSTQNGTYTGNGVLDTTGATQAWFAGKEVLIDPSPSLTNAPFLGPFAIQSVVDGDEIAVSATDAQAIEAVLGAGDNVVWHVVWPIEALSPNEFSQRQRALVQNLVGITGTPKKLSPFVAPLEQAPLSQMGALAAGPYLVEDGWLGVVPQDEHLKAIYDGVAAPVISTTALAAEFGNPELSWEYFDGDGWRKLGAAEGLVDATLDFAGSGSVSFVVPDGLSKAEIGGQEDYWVRARLVGGDYGRPRYIVEQKPGPVAGDLIQNVVVSTDHMRPPEISRLTSRFTLPPDHVPDLVVARNNLRDLDQSSANRRQETAFRMFYGAFEPPLVDASAKRRAQIGEDRLGRAMLIGFSRPLETGLISLFVSVADREAHQDLEFSTLGADGAWSPAPLAEVDATHGFNRSGLVTLSIASRPAQTQLFGRTLHWLRVRAVGHGAADWLPRIHGLWPNGVPIRQTETVLHEPLGSSDGEPYQEVQLLKTRILPQTLELRVRERLGTEEVAELRAAFGEAAVLDTVPNLPGQWVRWRWVESLTDQSGDDRVFLANASGKVSFGDGQNGRLPLAGRDNLRAFSYQSGGERTETIAFADAGIRGSLEGLDAVLAPAAIAGGRDLLSRPEMVARVPDALRHANQGLSLSDIEAMARDIDSEIVQVRAFPPGPQRDGILVSVLARGAGRAPVYSLARREQLSRALRDEMSDAWSADCLVVQSVKFAEVIVDLSLVAKPGQAARLQSEAKERLDRFLDASAGGPEGQGWPPGRPLWPTDIRRELSDLGALSRVEDIDIARSDGGDINKIAPYEVIAAIRSRDITISVVEDEAP